MLDTIQTSLKSGLAEIFFTYPIDYWKTIQQAQFCSSNPNCTSSFKHSFWTNPYRGLSTRLVGILPTRMAFWGSMEWSGQKKLSWIEKSTCIAGCETLVDFPVEQCKVQKMLNNRSPKQTLMACRKMAPNRACLAFSSMFARNMGFIMTYEYSQEILRKQNMVSLDDPRSTFFISAVSGILGSVVSQPLDTLKTYYQYTATHHHAPLWRFPLPVRSYFVGLPCRCLANFLGMGIGGWILQS